MGDEALKRDTDCVYFLASPLTCKKGIDCEYRHSESARLNPRDCWYWLNGNCQNPVCAFRHPPLDGRPETSVEVVSLPNQASVPVNKTNITCYYYFNGFCNRGESCFFLHGPDDATAARFTKIASTVTCDPPIEAKASTSNGKLPLQVEAPIKPLETECEDVENIQVQPKVDIKTSASYELAKQNGPVQVPIAEHEEIRTKLERRLPEEDVIDGGCFLYGEETPEEQEDGLVGSQGSPEAHADGHAQPEEWLESSPGFDVLVDDGAENLGYDEDEQEYMLVHEREAGICHRLHQYDYEDYEDSMRFDPTDYSDARLSYEQERELYGSVDNEHVPRCARRVSNRAVERMQDPMMFQRSSSRKVKHGKRNVDLREHLRKRRRTEGRRESDYSRSHGLYHLNDRSQERPGRRHVAGSIPNGRLASEIGKNMINSKPDDETSCNYRCQEGLLRHSHGRCVRPRLHEKDRRRQAGPKFMFSYDSWRMSSVEAAAPIDFTSFSGPKSLAEIKEEKRKAMGNENGFGTKKHKKTSSQDFEGPKALREILQEKGKLDAVH